MNERYDILLQDNRIVVQNGDLVIAQSDAQHKQDTINAFPGWWKENPADGVGILSYLKSRAKKQELSRKITIQLQADDYADVAPVITFIEKDKLEIEV